MKSTSVSLTKNDTSLNWDENVNCRRHHEQIYFAIFPLCLKYKNSIGENENNNDNDKMETNDSDLPQYNFSIHLSWTRLLVISFSTQEKA